jgi:hypothetical protein
VAIVDLSGLVGTALGFALGYAVGSNANQGDSIAQGARFALGGMALGLVSGGFVARSWGKKRLRIPPVGHAQLDLPSLHFDRDRTMLGDATRVTVTLLSGRF